MADNTKIEWVKGRDGEQGATWNPITGCSVHSAGCTNCYAMKLAGTRLQHHPSRAGLTTQTKAGPVWNGQVRFNEDWLTQPLQWKRPRMIFVCAHADLFHEACSQAWLLRIFAVMIVADWHTYQVLTKRSDRMRKFMHWICETEEGAEALCEAVEEIKAEADLDYNLPPKHVWLGVSVENQAAADERIPDLLATPAAVRWISAEPLLGPLDLMSPIAIPHIMLPSGATRDDNWGVCPLIGKLAPWLDASQKELDAGAANIGAEYNWARIDWVVAGGESGTGARPMHPDWARSLRDQCAAAGTPFFFKQWGEWMHEGQNGISYTFNTSKGRAQSLPAFILKMDGTVHCFLPPDEQTAPVVLRIGKKAAGRLLDGVEHNGMPANQ